MADQDAPVDVATTPLGQLKARYRRYERERRIVSLVGFAPLLVLYVLTHSSWLKTQMPASKEMAVLYLIVLPLCWFAFVMLLHGAWAPARHGLRCGGCGARWVGRNYELTARDGHCVSCARDIAELR